MNRALLTSLLLCLVLCAPSLLAQEIRQQGGDVFVPAPPPPPVTMPTIDSNSHHAGDEGALVFKSETVLVQVPAVVTDKSGSHVHGLNKDDFKILENGKPQKMTAFEEVTATDDRPATPTSAPGTFSNLVVDQQQPRAITVIALDTVNTPFLDQAYGRKELIKYLADHLESGGVLGLVVVGSKGVKVLSGLNSDPATLIAALKQASGEVSPMQAFGAEGQALGASGGASALTGGTKPGEGAAEKMRQFILNADALEGAYQQSRAIEDTMKAFLTIAWSLSGIPGRKSLIWATGSFPFTLDSPSSVPGGSLSALYERAMEALKDAQISVYPVDVRGLVSAGGDVAYSGTDSANIIPGRSWLQNSSLDTLKTFAEMTGGRAYYNNNDLAAGFKRAADDSSSYYLLSYYMNTHNSKPGWRKLQVEVQRKDAEVRARTGFFVTNATIDPELTHKAEIGLALSSPFDSTGISVTVKWQGMSADGAKKKVAFALHVPATGMIDEADKNRFDVDFIAQATQNGTPAANAGQTTKGTIPAAALPKIKSDGIFYQNALELPPGSYDVRFVVRDNLSGRIGSVTAPLSVN